MQYEFTPAPADPTAEPATVISPGTPVALSLRTATIVIIAIVSVVLSGAGGYYALASTDRAHATKVEQLERRVEGFATKADLRELRMKVRMDMLSSVWDCVKDGAGLQCRPRLPRGYDDGTSTQ